MTFVTLASEQRTQLDQTMAMNLYERILQGRAQALQASENEEENSKHSFTKVAAVRGVTFINDSKAVSINTTWYSLERCEGQIIWIAGEKSTENDYELLRYLVEDKVKAIVTLCKHQSGVIDNFSGDVKMLVHAENMQEAVEASFYLAQPGDTVLFSPASQSMDMFENYIERGNKFVETVKKL
jgi:UDP-N-acetylmuramoylalanine--D-glutamate ligase